MAAFCLNSFIKLLKEDTSVFLVSNPDFGRYIGELVVGRSGTFLTVFCMVGGDKQHCNVWYAK